MSVTHAPTRQLRAWLQAELSKIENARATAIEHARISDRIVCVTAAAHIDGHDWAKVSDGAHHILAYFRPQPGRIVEVEQRSTIRIVAAGLGFGPAVDLSLEGPASSKRTLFLVVREWQTTTVEAPQRQTTLITSLMQGWLKNLSARTNADALIPAELRTPDSSLKYQTVHMTSADITRIEADLATKTAFEGGVSREKRGDAAGFRRIEDEKRAGRAEVLDRLRAGHPRPPSPIQLEPESSPVPEQPASASQSDDEIAVTLGARAKMAELHNDIRAIKESTDVDLPTLARTLAEAAAEEQAAYSRERPAPAPIAVGQPHPPRPVPAGQPPAPEPPSTDSTRGHGFFSDLSGEQTVVPSSDPKQPHSPAAGITTEPPGSPTTDPTEISPSKFRYVPASRRETDSPMVIRKRAADDNEEQPAAKRIKLLDSDPTPKKRKKARRSTAIDLPPPGGLLRHKITHFPFFCPITMSSPRLRLS